MGSSGYSVAVIIVAFGRQPTLEKCVNLLAVSGGLKHLDIVIVDNGAEQETLAAVQESTSARIVGEPLNRGFAGGCNFGVQHTDAEHLVFLNSDAFVSPNAIFELVDAVQDDRIGIATASLRLDNDAQKLNSAGNPVHFSGLTWSGAFGENAANYQDSISVSSASGAAMALTRKHWSLLRGFDEAYFAYLEDTDLSIRTWLCGKKVVYVPTAIVRHKYDFSRNKSKMFLLERNRWLFLLTTYRRTTLLLFLPALFLVEFLVFIQSILSGWVGDKLLSYWSVLKHGSYIKQKYREIQAYRVLNDSELLGLLVAKIEPKNLKTPPGMSFINNILAIWYRCVKTIIR